MGTTVTDRERHDIDFYLWTQHQAAKLRLRAGPAAYAVQEQPNGVCNWGIMILP
jgi:hypothetical protein